MKRITFETILPPIAGVYQYLIVDDFGDGKCSDGHTQLCDVCVWEKVFFSAFSIWLRVMMQWVN